ncbi:16S rRNA (adenine(1518)-N(6)/adenine(1519)-N(6))-dimethyltransferase RsmA [Flavobacteriaceae bacterium F08102]|nr:16S rRNA (adenine(1518)-N(6)/adenine(1519)-N(6))-dimethyltransferase RsmA [Flavobacteriaceae bacterium F08102]
MSVKPKKHLGQHFLNDEHIAKKIADTARDEKGHIILEVGPGMGVLTKYLEQKSSELHVVEIDRESVHYLNANFPDLTERIHEIDFLRLDLATTFPNQQLSIIGNFPYNISSQIVFHALENKDQVVELSGMFQKEVAKRISEKPGSKAYGILSVLTQAYYDVSYLFSVPPEVFNPPPKVDSGVIKMTRKRDYRIPVDEVLFKKVVKTAFNQRRKTLRNSLKSFNLSDKLSSNVIFANRPEQLSVAEFIDLTQKIATDGI